MTQGLTPEQLAWLQNGAMGANPPSAAPSLAAYANGSPLPPSGGLAGAVANQDPIGQPALSASAPMPPPPMAQGPDPIGQGALPQPSMSWGPPQVSPLQTAPSAAGPMALTMPTPFQPGPTPQPTTTQVLGLGATPSSPAWSGVKDFVLSNPGVQAASGIASRTAGAVKNLNKAYLGAFGIKTPEDESETPASATPAAEAGDAKRADLVSRDGLPPGFTPVQTEQGQPITIPAHTEHLLDPETEKERDLAANKAEIGVEGQQTAQTELGQAAAAKANIEAQGANDVGESMGKESEAITKEADARRAQQAQWQNQIAMAHYAAMQAGMAVDPNRYFKSLGTWDRVRLGLASFFGGFSSGWRGGPNPGLEEIHRGIDNDIAQQRGQVEALKGFANNLDTLYAQAYKATGDHLDATILARGLMTKMVTQKAMASAIAAGSPIEVAKAKDLAAKLEEHDGEVMRQAWIDKSKTERRVPTQVIMPAGQSPGIVADKDVQEKMGKELQEAKIPQTEAALTDAERLFNNSPSMAGVSSARYAAGGEGPLSRWVSSEEANKSLQTIDSLAYAYAEMGGRGATPVKVELAKKILRGDGSPAGLMHGLKLFREKLENERDNVESHHDPAQVMIARYRAEQERQINAARNAFNSGPIGGAGQPPPTLPPGTPLVYQKDRAPKGGGKGSGKGTTPKFDKALSPLKE